MPSVHIISKKNSHQSRPFSPFHLPCRLSVPPFRPIPFSARFRFFRPTLGRFSRVLHICRTQCPDLALAHHYRKGVGYADLPSLTARPANIESTGPRPSTPATQITKALIWEAVDRSGTPPKRSVHLPTRVGRWIFTSSPPRTPMID